MNPKALIDLHCDTLTDCRPTPAGNPDTLDDPERVLSLSAMPEDVHWAQFYAVFIPDEYRGQAAIEYFEQKLMRDILNFESSKSHALKFQIKAMHILNIFYKIVA